MALTSFHIIFLMITFILSVQSRLIMKYQENHFQATFEDDGQQNVAQTAISSPSPSPSQVINPSELKNHEEDNINSLHENNLRTIVPFLGQQKNIFDVFVSALKEKNTILQTSDATLLKKYFQDILTKITKKTDVKEDVATQSVEGSVNPNEENKFEVVDPVSFFKEDVQKDLDSISQTKDIPADTDLRVESEMKDVNDLEIIPIQYPDSSEAELDIVPEEDHIQGKLITSPQYTDDVDHTKFLPIKIIDFHRRNHGSYSSDQVTLYKENDFQGESITLPLQGCVFIPKKWNDQASSIKPTTCIIVYRDYYCQSTSKRLEIDSPERKQLNDIQMDKFISSFSSC